MTAGEKVPQQTCTLTKKKKIRLGSLTKKKNVRLGSPAVITGLFIKPVITHRRLAMFMLTSALLMCGTFIASKGCWAVGRLLESVLVFEFVTVPSDLAFPYGLKNFLR